MGKLKETYLNNLSEEDQHDLQRLMDLQAGEEYQEYRQSNEYVEMVNEEIEKTKPKYSDKDVEEALKVAFQSITIDPREVGPDVFGQLIHDETQRYLESLNKSF
jgi:alpha-amylase/alpha-mannosidase (GH57 family)